MTHEDRGPSTDPSHPEGSFQSGYLEDSEPVPMVREIVSYFAGGFGSAG
jgi:hypothetical protein